MFLPPQNTQSNGQPVAAAQDAVKVKATVVVPKPAPQVKTQKVCVCVCEQMLTISGDKCI